MQTLSLVVVTFTYLLVGAAIFDALEGTNNENALEGLVKVNKRFFFLLSLGVHAVCVYTLALCIRNFVASLPAFFILACFLL